MGDGIGGPVMGILANNAFQLLVSHVRKDNKEEYGKTEKIIIAKIFIMYSKFFFFTTAENYVNLGFISLPLNLIKAPLLPI